MAGGTAASIAVVDAADNRRKACYPTVVVVARGSVLHFFYFGGALARCPPK